MRKEKHSAGLLMFRRGAGGAEVFLVHPGGPFFKGRDEGVWSIPKGEFEPGEDPLEVARREFAEETSQAVEACAKGRGAALSSLVVPGSEGRGAALSPAHAPGSERRKAALSPLADPGAEGGRGAVLSPLADPSSVAGGAAFSPFADPGE